MTVKKFTKFVKKTLKARFMVGNVEKYFENTYGVKCQVKYEDDGKLKLAPAEKNCNLNIQEIKKGVFTPFFILIFF